MHILLPNDGNVLWPYYFAGFDPRQARDEESLRVPSLQNQAERPHLRLDLQPENQGETVQMDTGWSGPFAPNLMYSCTQDTEL